MWLMTVCISSLGRQAEIIWNGFEIRNFTVVSHYLLIIIIIIIIIIIVAIVSYSVLYEYER